MHDDRQNGFTLVELIASLVLVGILVATAGMGLVMGTRGYTFTRDNIAMTQKSQLAVARLRIEIKELVDVVDETFSLAGNDAYLIYDTATGRRAIAKTGKEILLYGLTSAATSLSGTGRTLIDSVDSGSDGLKMDFYQADDSVWEQGTDPLGDLTRIDFRLRIHPPGSPAATQDFSTSVLPRNR